MGEAVKKPARKKSVSKTLEAVERSEAIDNERRRIDLARREGDGSCDEYMGESNDAPGFDSFE